MSERYPELCAKCGIRLYGDPLRRPARLCPRHLQEARSTTAPSACSTAVIDEGMGEPLAPEPKGTLTATECNRETTCCVCGAPMSPGEWLVSIPARGDAQPMCAGDAGWAIR